MSKLTRVLLVCCAFFVFSNGSNCPLLDGILRQPGSSLITRHQNGTLTFANITCPENTIFSAAELKCIEVPNSDVKCTRSGRVLDNSSTNCSTYLICTQLEDGSYISKQVKCPTGMLFSPSVNRCVSVNDYTCPGSTHSVCKSDGRMPDPNSLNCSSYLLCTQIEDGSYSSKLVYCPSGTIFSANASRCISNTIYICPNAKNETYENLQSSECTANGRFPDSRSTNCTTYKICTLLEDGRYAANHVICPIGTLFSSIVRRCVSNTSYDCVENQNKTNVNHHTSGCLGGGRFHDPDSINGSSYLICTQLADGNYTSTKVACPIGTKFSSYARRCISNASNTDSGYKNETHEILQTTGCQSNGRFLDPTSSNCTTYVICTQLEDGSYSSNQVTCPTGTLFSSIVNRCVSNSTYICPKIQNDTHENLQSTGCRGNGRFPDPNSSNCTSYLICTELEDGRYRTSSATCPPETIFSSIVNRCVVSSNYTCRGSCRSEGLFLDPNSLDCSTYISCSHDLVPQTIKCPQYTLFSIEKRDCIIACDVTCHAA